jgi:hypothetical protein
MKACRVLMALLALMILSFPASTHAQPEEDGAAPAARGEYDQNKLTPSFYEAELKQSGGSYSNSSFNISIPSNATIYSASVDLEGKPVVLPTDHRVCDFIGGGDADYKAYKGTYTFSSPGNAKPSTFSGNEFVSYEYTQVSSLDGTIATQYAYSQEYGYHHFAFRLPFDITANVTVEWTGRGGYPYGTTYPGSCSVFLWNNLSTGWELVDSRTGTTYQTVSRTFIGAGYIDQNHIVHALAIGTGSTVSYNAIMSDYVKVTVDGNQLSYAKNPYMYFGNLNTPAWKLTEEKFNYAMTIEDASLMNDIQKLVRNQTTENVAIIVRLTSNAAGKIKISNFKVSYQSPPWCKGIPSTFHIMEDESVQKLFDIDLFWKDDVKPLKLTYNISWQEDIKKLKAQINEDGHNIDFTIPSVAKNWWGTMRFRVGALDTDGLTRDSNTFYVTVDPVNDPPVIPAIAKQEAMQGVRFNMTIKVRDVDMDLDPTEELTFADNSSLFNIDTLSGEIAFTPSQEQVGVYNIQITVADREGETDSENFTLEVKDAEDPPILDPIPEQTASEDIPFTYTVLAFDQDVPYGDELTFSDDSPSFQINASTGIIDFTPTAKDIGIQTVTITVRDRAGMNATQQFSFTIMNSIGTLDRPPVLEPIPNQTAYEGVPFELTVNASDPDLELGDALTFSDNSPIFDINGKSGKISFKPASKDAGTVRVKITVKDRDLLTATAEFYLTIIKTNRPPVVNSILPKDGARVSQNKRVVLSVFAGDPDGDVLNFTWKDGDNILGYGANLTWVFRDAGTYIITLTVSDGKTQVSNETALEVVEQGQGGGGKGVPGFGAALALTALVAAIMVLAGKSKR